MANYAHDLFLLSTNLSQFKSKVLIIKIFIESINSIFSGHQFTWNNETDKNAEANIKVCTRSKTYGYLCYYDQSTLTAETIALLQNAVQMLAILLENLEQEKLLTYHNEHLDSLVKEKTYDLLKSQQQFDETSKMAKVGGWQIDFQGNTLSWTSETYRIHELPVDNMPNVADAINFYHPDDRQMVSEHVQMAVEKGTSFDFQARLITAKNNLKWVRAYGKMVSVGGQDIGIHGMIQDITEQKLVEDALVKNQFYLTKAQEIGKIGTWELDILNNKLFWTKQNYENFGIKLGTKLSYELFLNCIHPDDRDYGHKEWSDAMEGNPYDIEHRILIDGNIKWLREKAIVKFDENGKAVSAIGFTQDITTFKESEQKLKESEQKFRVLADNTHDWEYWMDENGEYIFISPSCKQITGFSQKDFYENPDLFLQLVKEEYQEEVHCHYHDKIRTAPFYTSEFPILNKNKEEIWIEHSCIPIFDENGKFLGRRGNNRDITKRKSNDKLLKESQERFELAMKASKDGLFDWNLLTNEIYYSPGWKHMLGYEYNELPNDFSIWETNTKPEDVAKSWEMQQELISRKRDRFELEFKMKHKKGHWVDILSRAEAVFNEEGKAIRIVGTHLDITEKNETFRKLKEAESNLQNTFNISPTIIGKANLNTGYFVSANEAVTRILGYEVAEFLAIPFKKLIHPDDNQETEHELKEQLAGKSVISFENRYLCKDGTYKWIAWEGTPADENGMVTAVGSDITERVKTREKLRENEEKYRLLHENAGLGIGYYRPDGIIISYNKVAAKAMNGEPDDFAGKSIFDIFPKPEAEFYFERIQKSCKSDRPIVYEDKVMLPIGDKYFLSTYSKITDSANLILGIQIISQDISEQKLTEAELIKAKEKAEESQQSKSIVIEKYNDAQKVAHVGNWDWNMITNEIWWSEGTYDIFDVKPYEFIPDFDNNTTFLLPSEIETYYAVFKNCIETGEVLNHDFTVKTAKGEIKYCNNQGKVEYNEKNEPIRFIGTLMDITWRKEIENAITIKNNELQLSKEKVEESELKFRGIYEQSPIAIEIYDKVGKLIDVNQQTLNMFGVVDKEHIMGFDLWADPNLSDERMKLLRSGQKIYLSTAFDFELVKENKLYPTSRSGKMYMDMYAIPLLNEKEIAGFLVQIVETTERKQAEGSLRESKDLYQSLFNQIADPVVVFDQETMKFLDCNISMIRKYGYSAEELSEMTPLDLHSIDENFDQVKENINSKEDISANEYRHVGKNGIIYYVETHTQAIHYKNRAAWITIIQDLTERKTAEEPTLELKKFNEAIVKNIAEGIILENDDGIIQFANPAMLKMLGYKEGELVGENWKCFVPDDQIEIVNNANKRRENGESDQYEMELIRKDGERIFVLVGGVPNINKGVYRGLLAAFTDISDRKKAEKALIEAKAKVEENESRLRNYFQLGLFGMAITSIDKQWIEVNETICNFLGYTKEELLKKSWIEFTHPDDVEIDLSHFDKVIKGETNGYKLEKRFIRKNGETIYTELEVQCLRDEKRNVKYFLALINDITERKIAEQQLIIAKEKAEESDRLKSAFLANMSHEIRTPMNGILGFAELLKEPNLSGETQSEYIKIIEKSGARMLSTINDIVDISKIEAGLMKLDIKESNVNEKMEYIFTFFKPEAEAKGMKLSIRNYLPTKEAIIQTDSEKLYAILTNLVKNAIKYAEKGSIEFGYDLVDINSQEYLQFYVKDTGIGIPRDRQEAIFERFIQAEIEDKKARQGSGLGLAITKSYVEMLGGKIWVESEVEIGSTFYFTLPYHAEPIGKRAEQNAVVPDTSDIIHKNLKILIAEDDEVSERLIGIAVKMFGKEILNARTGIEAVEACRANPDIDLILMDIQMPEMSGYEATRQIRDFNKDVIIIAQTAFGQTGDKEKAIEAGCNDHISKPIKSVELHDMIKKYFKNKI